MAIRPAVPERPPARPRTQPDWTPPDTDTYRDLHELRARTIQRAERDPLHDTDWWAVIEQGHTQGDPVYRRVWRLKNETRLPTGIWTIISGVLTPDAPDACIYARFEGYRPHWTGRSSVVTQSGYHKSVRVIMEGETPVPSIPAGDHQTLPDPDELKTRKC
jgi:hypothetical protein